MPALSVPFNERVPPGNPGKHDVDPLNRKTNVNIFGIDLDTNNPRALLEITR